MYCLQSWFNFSSEYKRPLQICLSCSSCPTALVLADPFALFGGFVAFVALQKWQAYQQLHVSEAAAHTHPSQVGIKIPLELFNHLKLSWDCPTNCRCSYIFVHGVASPPPPPPYRNIVQHTSIISYICEDMSLSSTDLNVSDAKKHPYP